MERIQAILADPHYEESIIKINLREIDRKFCCHNLQHFVDVARITYVLMLESGIINKFKEQSNLNTVTSKELIYAAALLHDIGRWRQYDTGEDHSVVSAELAIEILKRSGFSNAEIEVIILAIKEHRRPADNKSILGEQLYKADKLSRLCSTCEARMECYKGEEMETYRKGLLY